jgi:uncharacterized ion transporter superfamily protein YfcC
MSGLLKPAISLTEQSYKTRFTLHNGFIKPASVLTAKSVSWNIDSGMAFNKVCILLSVFMGAVYISIFVKKVKKMLKP